MSLPFVSDIYSFYRETLERAACELKSRQGRRLNFRLKSDTSLVTEADLASERAILDALGAHFPSDVVYSEESGLSRAGRTPGSYIWLVDPLDGTTNFANGYPFYCISVARGQFRTDGTIEILSGAIWDAPRERLFYAEKGAGAYVDGTRLEIAAPRPFSQTFLVTGFYYNQGDQLQAQIQRFARVAQRCQTIRRDGAAALDLALVAEGTYDAFWEMGLQPWDVAAGSLLVTEAGGTVSNYPEDQSPHYNPEGAGIIAGSPSSAAEIRGLL